MALIDAPDCPSCGFPSMKLKDTQVVVDGDARLVEGLCMRCAQPIMRAMTTGERRDFVSVAAGPRRWNSPILREDPPALIEYSHSPRSDFDLESGRRFLNASRIDPDLPVFFSLSTHDSPFHERRCDQFGQGRERAAVKGYELGELGHGQALDALLSGRRPCMACFTELSRRGSRFSATHATRQGAVHRPTADDAKTTWMRTLPTLADLNRFYRDLPIRSESFDLPPLFLRDVAAVAQQQGILNEWFCTNFLPGLADTLEEGKRLTPRQWTKLKEGLAICFSSLGTEPPRAASGI